MINKLTTPVKVSSNMHFRRRIFPSLSENFHKNRLLGINKNLPNNVWTQDLSLLVYFPPHWKREGYEKRQPNGFSLSVRLFDWQCSCQKCQTLLSAISLFCFFLFLCSSKLMLLSFIITLIFLFLYYPHFIRILLLFTVKQRQKAENVHAD